MFHEAQTVLPDMDTDDITAEQMANQLTYSKAVLKETFRLNPVSVGVGRITNTDLILSGYNVPKGVIGRHQNRKVQFSHFNLLIFDFFFFRFQTIIVTQNFISCRLEKHFDMPEKFIPERWLKSSDVKSSKPINPYLVLPFSHGIRACIARRFAEQNMLVLMLRVRTHKIPMT